MIEKIKPLKSNLQTCLRALGYVVHSMPDEGTIYTHKKLPDVMVFDGEK